MSNAPSVSRRGLTPVQWLICTIAAIGFAFDIYELLMLPLIVRPALMELGGITPGRREFTDVDLRCCSTCRPSRAASSACWAAT